MASTHGHLEERGIDSERAAALAPVVHAVTADIGRALERHQRTITGEFDGLVWATICMAGIVMAQVFVALILFAFVLVAIGNDSPADVRSDDPPPTQEAPLNLGR